MLVALPQRSPAAAASEFHVQRQIYLNRDEAFWQDFYRAWATIARSCHPRKEAVLF
jgi:hypothetical protein